MEGRKKQVVKGRDQRWPGRGLVLSLVVYLSLSIYDLCAPPISQTLWRQCQTSEVSRSFAESGFNWKGLSLPVSGAVRTQLVYEFPIFNAVQGIGYLLGLDVALAGKLISFLFGAASCMLIHRILLVRVGESAAAFGTIAFAIAPVSALMNTSAQPDAMALAFAVLGLHQFLHSRVGWGSVFGVAVVTVAALVKFPVVVPFLPAYAWALFKGEQPDKTFWVRHIGAGLIACAVFLAWQLYRASHFPDALQTREQLIDMLLIGDLRRFASLAFYFKPCASFVVLMCAFGLLPIIVVALTRWSVWAILAIAGLVLLLAVVPTSAQQYYYLYPVMPLLAIAMGEEWSGWRNRPRMFGVAALASSGVIAACFLYPYVLRQDRVTYELGKFAAVVTQESDLILVACHHDRVIGRGSFNPAFFFFAKRRGWNSTLTDPEQLISEARRLGAQWVVVTWYSPDLEVWWNRAMPSSMRNDPKVDVRQAIEEAVEDRIVALRTENGVMFRP